jgi:FkbM family methyltransferase
MCLGRSNLNKKKNHNDFSVDEDYIRSFDFEIDYLIDIGVFQGTPTLYKAFSGKRIIAIDPLVECDKFLNNFRTQGLDIDFQCYALGEMNGHRNLMILSGPGGSGFVKRKNAKSINIVEERKVEILTLDSLLEKLKIYGRLGIKIDVEGYEIYVLRGAINSLKKAIFVVVECPVKRNYISNVFISDIISFMAENGFELFDNCKRTNQPTNNWDCVFVPRDSQLLNRK